jgi:hypothetical protein
MRLFRYFSFLFFLLLFVFNGLQAQQTLSGIVEDAVTAEKLPGVFICSSDSSVCSVSDNQGQFKLKMPAKNKFVCVSYLSYNDTVIELSKASKPLVIRLTPKSTEIHEVVVVSKKEEEKKRQTGMVTLKMKEMRNIVSFMGASDPIKLLQLKPGMSLANESDGGIYVRGGDNGQNLVLLDGIPLHNPTHLMGFYSVFQESVIQSLDMYKSAPPAMYGGSLSSVIDIKMNNSSGKACEGELSTGVLSSSLMLQGKTDSAKFYYLLGARQAYLGFLREAIVKPLFKKSTSIFNNTQYRFGDYYGKFAWQTGAHSFLNLAAYWGTDNYQFVNEDYDIYDNMNWGNSGLSARWMYSKPNAYAVTVMAGISDYEFEMQAGNEEVNFALSNQFNQYFSKFDVQKQVSGNDVYLGCDYQYNVLTPNNYSLNSSGIQIVANPKYYNALLSPYLQINWKKVGRFSLNTGIRVPVYWQYGPVSYYDDIQKDTIKVAKGKLGKRFVNAEPRVNLNYSVNEQITLKSSFSLLSQQIHQVPLGSVSLPTDFWVPSSALVSPAKATQYTLGYYGLYSKQNLDFYVEAYYRKMSGLLELNQRIFSSDSEANIENFLYHGNGYAYGIECYVQKKVGNYTGWISYVYSHSYRQFADIQASSYPAKYDRPHDVKIVQAYQINKNWRTSVVWVYASGNVMSLPVGRYIVQGNVLNDYGNINNFRLPAYHRLDISATRNIHINKYLAELSLAVYNAYNRSNPYYYYYKVRGKVDSYYLKVELRKVSLFPVLPAISFKIYF